MSRLALQDAIFSGPRALSRDVLQIGEEGARKSEVLRLGGSVDAILPDGGLPRSAVVEVASPLGLAGATSFAVKACVAAQAAKEAGGSSRSRSAWCAWLDPWSTLHAPGLHQRGVDLERLLVVRSPEEALARCAVRVVSSKAFALVVIDLVPPLGLGQSSGKGQGLAGQSYASQGYAGPGVRLDRWPNVVRRLALAASEAATTVLLLTDHSAHRTLPLPVAIRIELERDRDRCTRLRIAKERHGRLSGFAPFVLPFDVASA